MPSSFTWASRHSNLGVFLFFAIALIVPSGYSVGSILLALAGLGLALNPRCWSSIRLSITQANRKLTWTVLMVMALFFLSWAAEILLDRQSASRLDKPLRIVYAALALLWLLRHPARPAFFWGGLASGAIAACGWASWQFFVQGLGRAGGHTNAIQFGNIALLMGMLCLAGVGWVWMNFRDERHSRLWAGMWTAALLLGFACGLLASLLSGSRGGWVNLPFVLLLVLFSYRRCLPRHVLGGLVLLLAAAIAWVSVAPNNPVQERVQSARNEASDYFQKNVVNTSVGLRLEMWKAGLLAVQDAPLLGHGQQGLWRYVSERVEQGEIDKGVLAFGHLHNDYLDIAGRRGLIGFGVLLALYLLPLWHFCGGLRKSADTQERPYALAGAVLCLSFLSYSLTQGFLTHNSGVMVFFFTLVICLSMMRASNGGQPNMEARAV